MIFSGTKTVHGLIKRVHEAYTLLNIHQVNLHVVTHIVKQKSQPPLKLDILDDEVVDGLAIV